MEHQTFMELLSELLLESRELIQNHIKRELRSELASELGIVALRDIWTPELTLSKIASKRATSRVALRLKRG